ncbi:hypothetical protein [Flavicella sp.]|uniref:hypothetical protein n=1 Tax=Flavicella sp. TaxID=2957742 RepID=UPI0030175C7A
MKEELIKYIELKIRYYRFEAVEKIGDLRAKLLVDILILFLFACLLLFLGFTTAVVLNAVFDSTYLGYVVVTLVLLFSVLILVWKRKTIISKINQNYLENNIPS